MTAHPTALVTAVAAALAILLLVPPRPSLPVPAPTRPAGGPDAARGWLQRHRLLWSVLAGVGAWAFLGGRAGPVAALLAGAAVWITVSRAESPQERRRGDAVRRELPHVVALFAAALRAGAAPGDAVALVCEAMPGPAADRLAGVAARLALGLDPVTVWASLDDDPQLARLGRALARAQATGASVVAVVERLADELAEASRADAEQRARAVGVKAAVPLGLCLLPAFLLIGIVPLAAALLATLDL